MLQFNWLYFYHIVNLRLRRLTSSTSKDNSSNTSSKLYDNFHLQAHFVQKNTTRVSVSGK